GELLEGQWRFRRLGSCEANDPWRTRRRRRAVRRRCARCTVIAACEETPAELCMPHRLQLSARALYGVDDLFRANVEHLIDPASDQLGTARGSKQVYR